MSDPTPTSELPDLIDPETIGKMAAAWALEHKHSQSATLEIVFRCGRYEVRMREEAWGYREIPERKDVEAAAKT